MKLIMNLQFIIFYNLFIIFIDCVYLFIVLLKVLTIYNYIYSHLLNNSVLFFFRIFLIYIRIFLIYIYIYHFEYILFQWDIETCNHRHQA